MKKSDTLCQRLGIKQQDMADYLGVSVFMMAQYETDRRNLPTSARLKLSHLELLLFQVNRQQKTATPLPQDSDHITKTVKYLQRQIASFQYKAQMAENKLTAMQFKCAQAGQLLQLLEALEAELAADHVDTLWVQIMQRSTLKKLQENGVHEQTKLLLRIGSLQQQENLAKKMMEGI